MTNRTNDDRFSSRCFQLADEFLVLTAALFCGTAVVVIPLALYGLGWIARQFGC